LQPPFKLKDGLAAVRSASPEIAASQKRLVDPCESRNSKNPYGCLLSTQEKQHGDITYLVCLDALFEAYRDLEEARLKCREAAHTLATIRETLDQTVELAYQQQSFGPLTNLFDEEEAALAVYERTVVKVGEAEGRWSALSVALAYEKERMMAAQLPRSQMN
jgi:hypothetical protein